MQVVDTLSACVDCYLYLANGDIPEDRPELPQLIQQYWPHTHLVVSGEGEEWFAWSQCQVCRSPLGGSRNEVVVME